MPPLNNFQKSCLALAVGNSLVSFEVEALQRIEVDQVNCTLRDAILSANSGINQGGCSGAVMGEAHQIDLPPNYPFTYDSICGCSVNGTNSALPPIAKDSTIIIAGNGSIIKRSDTLGTPIFRILSVLSGADVTLRSVTLENGAVSPDGKYLGGGAGIMAYGATLTLEDSKVTGSTAASTAPYSNSFGGGIYVRDSVLTLNNSEVSGNTVSSDSGTAYGGGIYARDSNVSVNTNSLITANAADVGAGMDLEYFSNLSMDSSTVSNNIATASFGGIYSSTPDIFTISNSTISGNQAGTFAAGVGVMGDGTTTMTITGGDITANIAADFAGGVYSDGMTLDISDVSITDNAAGFGAGVYINNTVATITDTTISANTATMSGGGIQVKALSSLTLDASTLTANGTSDASGNGGAICTADSTLIINNTAISGSTTAGNGAAIFSAADEFSPGQVEINKSTLSGNIAGGQGGAVYHAGSSFMMRVSTISGNQAAGRSALSLGGAAIDVIGSTIYDNATTGIGPNAISVYSLGANFTNTIVAGSTTADCNPTSAMFSQNNWFEDASCDGTANGKAFLNPLADNSVNTTYTTLTHLPTLGNGINGGGLGSYCGGSAETILQADQRTEPRGVTNCDIGSVEGGLAGPVEEDACFIIKAAGGQVINFCL